MARDWNQTTGTDEFVEWWRSPQQLIQCPPGQAPTLSGTIQIVRQYSSGQVIVRDAPAVNISLPELEGEDLADALLIKDAMFRILARRVDPASME